MQAHRHQCFIKLTVERTEKVRGQGPVTKPIGSEHDIINVFVCVCVYVYLSIYIYGHIEVIYK